MVTRMTTTTIAITATTPEMAAMSMARLTERRSMIRSMREGVGGTLAAPPAPAAGAGDMTGGWGGLAWVGSAPAPLRKLSSVSPIRTRSPPRSVTGPVIRWPLT